MAISVPPPRVRRGGRNNNQANLDIISLLGRRRKRRGREGDIIGAKGGEKEEVEEEGTQINRVFRGGGGGGRSLGGHSKRGEGKNISLLFSLPPLSQGKCNTYFSWPEQRTIKIMCECVYRRTRRNPSHYFHSRKCRNAEVKKCI